MAQDLWNISRKAIIGLSILVVFCLMTALPTLADPAEDKWKEEIFTWLENNAISGKTRTPKVTQLQPNADLLGHRYDCLESVAFRMDIPGWDIGDDLFFGSQIGGRAAPLTWIEDRYWGGVGCRPRSCGAKALILADTHDRLIHYGLIHYSQWHETAPSDPVYPVRPYFSIFLDPATSHKDLSSVARLAQDLAETANVGHPALRGPGRVYAITCAK